MNTQPLAKAEIHNTVSLQEYQTACLLVQRRFGGLRALPYIVLVAAGLLYFGLSALQGGYTDFFSFAIALLLCLGCPGLLLIGLWMMPSMTKKRAAKDYETYQSLMQPAVMRLYADEMVTQSPTLVLTDPYAVMTGCIETPSMLILVKDRERLLIIPKNNLSVDQYEEVLSFFRLVFARRRMVMKNWLF